MYNLNLEPTPDDDSTCATCLYRLEHCECRAVADDGPALWPQHLIDELFSDQQYVYFEPLSDLDPGWDVIVVVLGELILCREIPGARYVAQDEVGMIHRTHTAAHSDALQVNPHTESLSAVALLTWSQRLAGGQVA